MNDKHDYKAALEALDKIYSSCRLEEYRKGKKFPRHIATIRKALERETTEIIQGFEKYYRRECFADSEEGLQAYMIYTQLADEVRCLREESQRETVEIEPIDTTYIERLDMAATGQGCPSLLGRVALSHAGGWNDCLDHIKAKGYEIVKVKDDD